MVVSPCYVPLIFWRDTTGAQDSFQFRVSYDLWCGADTAPPFLCLSGARNPASKFILRIYGNPSRPKYNKLYGLHPPPAWERAESVYADYAVRHGGTFSFSNSSSKTIICNIPKIVRPIRRISYGNILGRGDGIRTPSPVFRIVRRKLLYVVSAEGQRNAAPPYNPVRRSWQHVPGLLGCGVAAQNRKSRLSAAANKSCLKGRPFIIWSCRPAPYGNGQPVCAASTGRADSPACSGGGFRVEFFY